MSEKKHDDMKTSSTLLRDLRSTGDEIRWTIFERTYRPLMRSMLHKMQRTLPGLNKSYFDDIIQETLVFLMKKFPTFTYDRSRGSFRGFLRGVLENKARKEMDKYWRNGRVEYNSEKADSAGLNLEAGKEADASAEQSELTCELWKLLLRRVFDGRKYTPRSQEIFKRLVSGVSPSELAGQYSMSENAIYQLKNRVFRDIRNMIRRNMTNDCEDMLDLAEKMLKEEVDNEKE